MEHLNSNIDQGLSQLSSRLSSRSSPKLSSNLISKLSCFAGKSIKVTDVNFGFSQQVFKVFVSQLNNTTLNKTPLCHSSQKPVSESVYIAKRFSDKSTAKLEMLIQQHLSDQGLAPKVIVLEGHWLVSEYIDRPLLSQLAISEAEQVSIATAALAKFHCALKYELSDSDNKGLLTSEINRLDLLQVLNDLSVSFYAENDCLAENEKLKSDESKTDQELIANAISCVKALKCHASNKHNLTIIHGDLNYSNLLITQSENSDDLAIIDFESVAIASVEYDLGMLMAINNVPLELSELAITSYLNNLTTTNKTLSKTSVERTSETTPKITLEPVTRYAFVSSVINWLWFLGQAEGQVKEKSKPDQQHRYLLMAKQQKNYAKMVLAALNR